MSLPDAWKRLLVIPCSTALFSRRHALKVPRSCERDMVWMPARTGQLASLSSAELKLWSLKSPEPGKSQRQSCGHDLGRSRAVGHHSAAWFWSRSTAPRRALEKEEAAGTAAPWPCSLRFFAQVSASVLGAKVLSCATLLSERHLVTAGQELRHSSRGLWLVSGKTYSNAGMG